MLAETRGMALFFLKYETAKMQNDEELHDPHSQDDHETVNFDLEEIWESSDSGR